MEYTFLGRYPIGKYYVDSIRSTGDPVKAHDVFVMSLLSVPWTRRLVAACSLDGLFSPGARRPRFAPTKLTLLHLGYQLASCPKTEMHAFPMTKHRMTRHQFEDILTQSPLPNASSAQTHPNSPLIHPREIVDSSSSRRTILQPLRPPSLNDHGYRLHQGCCPAWVAPSHNSQLTLTDSRNSCWALRALATSRTG